MREASEATLRLHRRLYPARAVKDSLAAFSEVATIHLEQDGDYQVLTLSSTSPELTAERLALELANFALSRAARSR